MGGDSTVPIKSVAGTDKIVELKGGTLYITNILQIHTSYLQKCNTFFGLEFVPLAFSAITILINQIIFLDFKVAVFLSASAVRPISNVALCQHQVNKHVRSAVIWDGRREKKQKEFRLVP